MKTRTQILDAIKGGRSTKTLDGRDYARLAAFFPHTDWDVLGLKPADGFDVSTYTPKELTRENVIEQLTTDLAFGFEKALNKRGISSCLMHEVILMWMWVLDDELAEFTDYAQYGLPLFKRWRSSTGSQTRSVMTMAMKASTLQIRIDRENQRLRTFHGAR